MVKAPNERKRPDLTPEDWEMALANLPLIYSRIARFGAKVMKRTVYWSGTFLTPSFEWHAPNGSAYGADPRSILEDLEARALEAAAEAAHSFDESRGFQFSTFLVKVVDRGLQHEFNSWVQTSSSLHIESDPRVRMSGSQEPDAFDEDFTVPEVYAPDELDPGTDGLTDAQRDALQAALGVLTSKEAIALRMYADDVPAKDIAETLGYKDVANVYQLLKRARTKAAQVYDQAVTQ